MSLSGRIVSRGARHASLCTLVSALVASAGAGAAEQTVPIHLVDGSKPTRLHLPFRSVHRPLVVTRARLLRARRLRSEIAACVPGDRVPGGRVVVERVGASGRTLTFVGPWPSVDACDRNPRALPKPWCGRAAWPLDRGRVSDSRLSICTDGSGRAVVAFAWINPVRGTAWVVVDQPGFGEVYRVAGRLPVRVSTVAGIEHGRATFRYRQYDAKGVMLASRSITPAIAG